MKTIKVDFNGEQLTVHEDTPAHIDIGLFRILNDEEKIGFRQYAKDNPGELNPIHHPIVQDERFKNS